MAALVDGIRGEAGPTQIDRPSPEAGPAATGAEAPCAAKARRSAGPASRSERVTGPTFAVDIAEVTFGVTMARVMRRVVRSSG